MSKRYKNDGNKCSIPWHNHPPHECPGRARIKCAICGKALIKHDSKDFCTADEGPTNHGLDELGVRRRRRMQ